MRFASLLQVLCVAVACAMAGPALTWAEPLATRQNVFSIPFRVDPPQDDAQRPVEVLLYASGDRGQSWKLAGRVRPEAAQFDFKAERDGEYWFLVRTKDQTGRLLPDRAATPEMQVVVDTLQPTLELNAVRGAAGEVTVKWKSADLLLEPHNLRIDYQAAGAADLWQAMALDAKKIERTAGTCRGELIWWPTPGAEPLTIRAEITDRAGNRTMTQAQVAQAQTAQPQATPAKPTPAQSAATQPPPFATTAPLAAVPVAIAPVAVTPNTAAPAAAAPSPGTPAEGRGEGSPRGSPVMPTPPVTQPVPPAAAAVPPAPTATRWPANDASAPPLGRAANQSPVQPFVVQRLPGAPVQPASTTQSATRPAASVEETLVQPPLRSIERGSDGRPLPAMPQADVPSSNAPPPYVPAPSAALPSVTVPNAAVLPVGERPLMVNARSFELDYDLRAVDPNTVTKVELWGTADGGQHWASYGVDLDRASPIVGNVEREGLFGFRVLVHTAGGRNPLPPTAGDRPEVWVGVDLSAPACRLTQVQQGRFLPGAADRSSEVAIAWESQDAAPTERAASLAYAEQSRGPWTEFATGLEPSGRFTWTMDPRVPERIYLRLQVRDQAGNVASTQTSEPLTLVNRPRVRVREVRPAYETGERLRTYRFF